jgi:hypothetical protein
LIKTSPVQERNVPKVSTRRGEDARVDEDDETDVDKEEEEEDNTFTL